MKTNETVIQAKAGETSVGKATGISFVALTEQENDDILAPKAFRKKLLDSFVEPNPVQRNRNRSSQD